MDTRTISTANEPYSADIFILSEYNSALEKKTRLKLHTYIPTYLHTEIDNTYIIFREKISAK